MRFANTYSCEDSWATANRRTPFTVPIQTAFHLSQANAFVVWLSLFIKKHNDLE